MFSSASDSDSDVAKYFGGSGVTYGGAIGFEVRGATFGIRPYTDFTWLNLKTTTDTSSGNSVETNTHTMMMTVGIAMAFYGGKELRKLEKMDDKLDRIEKKLGESPPK